MAKIDVRVSDFTDREIGPDMKGPNAVYVVLTFGDGRPALKADAHIEDPVVKQIIEAASPKRTWKRKAKVEEVAS